MTWNVTGAGASSVQVRAGAQTQSVEVTVTRVDVHLGGTARSQAERDFACRLAAATPFVRRVLDNISVMPEPVRPAATPSAADQGNTGQVRRSGKPFLQSVESKSNSIRWPACQGLVQHFTGAPRCSGRRTPPPSPPADSSASNRPAGGRPAMDWAARTRRPRPNAGIHCPVRRAPCARTA